jgi:hypothetical protein
LRVVFPDRHDTVLVRVSSVAPLKELLTHAFMQGQYVAHATFFQQVGHTVEWQQIDAECTPKQLGLKDNAAIVIRI